jgi:hypothetical protein
MADAGGLDARQFLDAISKVTAGSRAMGLFGDEYGS